ncbi:MAG: hypothetical protein ACTSUE_04795 [Promethearchaeota archaeon]
MMQIETSIGRSITFSTIHLICIAFMVFLLVKTWGRYREKRGKHEGRVSIGSPLFIMLTFEFVILIGLVFQHVSSDLLLYLRVKIKENPAFTAPVLTATMENLNMFFQVLLIAFIGLLGWFANELFFLKGHRFNHINSLAAIVMITFVTIGVFAGFAWQETSVVTGKRNPQVWVMAINGLYLFFIILPAIFVSVRIRSRSESTIDRGGFLFITLFFVAIILLVVLQAIFQLTYIYGFSYASWLVIPAGIFMGYLGLIMPPGLKAWLERKY